MSLKNKISLGIPPLGNAGPWYKSINLKLNNTLPSYISQFDMGRYYTSTTGPRAFPYTFTRAGNATHFDAQGRLVWAKANMFTYSDDLTNAIWTKNDTTISAAGETAPSGAAASLATEGTAGTALLQQQVTGQGVNSPYAYTVEVKRGNTDWMRIFIGGGGNDVRAWFNLATGTMGTNSAAGVASLPKAAEIVDLGGGWYRCTVYAATINSSSVVFLTVSAPSDNSNARVNNATRILGRQQLELLGPDSPKLPLSKSVASAYYEPRFDYDPVTLAPRGILVEPARTNTVTAASLSTNAAALSTGGTYLGGWAFDRVTASGASAIHSVSSTSLTPSATQTRRINAVVKPISGAGLIQLAASINHSDATVYANFNLNTGTIGDVGAGATDATCVPLGNGIYKIGLTYVTTAVPTSGALVALFFIAATTDTRAPSNTSADVIDINFFDSATTDSDSSIIPTFGTAATRAADNVSETVGSWLDTNKGTVYIDAMRQFVAAGSGTSGTFGQISDGTNNNRIVVVTGSGTNSQHRFDVLSGGVAQAQIQTSVSSLAFTNRKIAGKYATNDFKAVENGGTVGADAAGTVPTGLTTVNIGRADTGAQLNGWVKEFRYYPDNSASDAQLQTLTT